MDYKINWANIVNGYKGFECLAVRYVQVEYDSHFEHTKDTRDGNKDAILQKKYIPLFLAISHYQMPARNGGWKQSTANPKRFYHVTAWMQH